MTTPSAFEYAPAGRDPRLRLIGPEIPPDYAVAVLHALDDVRILFRFGEDCRGGAAVAPAAAAALSPRLFGDVRTDRDLELPPNWWLVRSIAELLDRTRALRPPPLTPPGNTIAVTIGAAGISAGDYGIGGDDWTARIDIAPVSVAVDSHGLGVHAAACLMTGQLLHRVLGPFGYPGVALRGLYALDLITHQPTGSPGSVSEARPVCMAGVGITEVGIAGVGSVGTSTAALLATALAPGYTTALPAAVARPRIVLIDADDFDPQRNPFRYPALMGGETGSKAVTMAERLCGAGLVALAAPLRVGPWVAGRERPGFDGLLVSSVDTLSGRLEVADVLARDTLSIGVAGLSLHAQREPVAAVDRACPYCDFVDAAPPSTQAEVHAAGTGLSVARILELLGRDDARLTAADLDLAVAAGRVPEVRRRQLVGAPLADLVRQAYAEAALAVRTGAGAPPPGGGSAQEVVAVAAPHVSWFAGTIAAAETIKQLLELPLLDGRVDVDLAGLPPGLLRRMPPDPTGTCLCRSAVRRRWAQRLYTGPLSAA